MSESDDIWRSNIKAISENNNPPKETTVSIKASLFSPLLKSWKPIAVITSIIFLMTVHLDIYIKASIILLIVATVLYKSVNKKRLNLYTIKQIETLLSGPPSKVPKEISLNSEHFKCIIDYARNFLAKEHPDLGRRGPVCPFVPRAIKSDSIRLAMIRTAKSPKIEDIIKLVSDALENFKKEASKMSTIDGIHLSYILIFPDIIPEVASEVIDVIQAQAKNDFVKNGFMIGEFHKYNNSPGLRNPNFYPLRTPIPCLAMRHMVVSDLAFLAWDKYSNEVQKEYLKFFLNRFGNSENKEIINAREMLKKL